VRDVEAIVEADPAKRAVIVDSKELAKRLIEMAKKLLGADAPRPGTAPSAAGAPARKTTTRKPR
jgi:hypothetical protein